MGSAYCRSLYSKRILCTLVSFMLRRGFRRALFGPGTDCFWLKANLYTIRQDLQGCYFAQLKELSCSRSTKGSLRHSQSFGVTVAPVFGLGSILIRFPWTRRPPSGLFWPTYLLRSAIHRASGGSAFAPVDCNTSGLTDPIVPFPLFEDGYF